MCRIMFIFTLFINLNALADVQVQTKHLLETQSSGKLGEFTQILVQEQKNQHILTVSGQARVTSLQSNQQGTTLIMGHFSGTMISGTNQIRAPHHNAIFYMVLDDSNVAKLRVLPNEEQQNYHVKKNANQNWFELQPQDMPSNEWQSEPLSIQLDEDGEPLDPTILQEGADIQPIIDNSDEDVIEDPSGG